MGCLVAAMILMVGGTILIVAVAAFTGANVPYNSAFREVARHLRGRLESGGTFSFPRVIFRYGEALGELSVVKTDGRRATQVTVGLAGTRVEWELVEGNQAFSQRRAAPIDVKLGDPRLDARLKAHTWNEAEFRQSMSEGTRWQLARLLALRSDLNSSVVKSGNRIAVRKHGLPTDWGQLLELIRVTCELYDQVQLCDNDSIEFVDGIEATLLEEVACPICGDLIQVDLVFCGGCKTPHHRDCWEYNGRCATYACGQERYVVPAVAKILQSTPQDRTDHSAHRGSDTNHDSGLH